MDFENFCNSYTNEPKDEEFFVKNTSENQNVNKESINQMNESDIQNKIEKYKGYNNQQLMAELLAEANKQKRNGNLTEKNLQEMVANLSPYLDESQKKRLNEIIKMLR